MNGGQQLVLVAGGGGVVGGQLASTLSKRGVRVLAVDIKPLDVDAYQLDLDGARNSPSWRLIRKLEPEPAVSQHDPYVWHESEPPQGADAVVIATNHSADVGQVFGLVHERALVE